MLKEAGRSIFWLKYFFKKIFVYSVKNMVRLSAVSMKKSSPTPNQTQVHRLAPRAQYVPVAHAWEEVKRLPSLRPSGAARPCPSRPHASCPTGQRGATSAGTTGPAPVGQKRCLCGGCRDQRRGSGPRSAWLSPSPEVRGRRDRGQERAACCCPSSHCDPVASCAAMITDVLFPGGFLGWGGP